MSGSYSERAQFSRHRCEDCGEPAYQASADGVWLCDGDMALLRERAYDDDGSPNPGAIP